MDRSRQSRVLVVEDDDAINRSLVGSLGDAGYEVRGLPDGRELETELDRFRPDLVVVDWMLPGRDGPTLSRVVRARSAAAVIMVTARDEVEDRLRGFDAGADDYVVKPFATSELLARSRAVLRRAGVTVGTIQVDDLLVDPGAARVTRGGVEIELTATELRLLVFLAENRDRVMSTLQILTQVWGYDDYADNLVQVHISALRRKIEAHGPRLVHTARGLGYVLRAPVSRTVEPVPATGLRTRSLRNRVTITVLVFLAAMLVVLAVVTDVALDARLEGELRQRLQDRATYANFLVSQRTGSQLVDELEGDGVSVSLTTSSGETLSQGPLAGSAGNVPTDPGPPGGPAGGPKGPVAEQGQILSVSERLSDGSTLVLLADSGDVQRTLDQVRTTLALGGLVLLALAALALRPVVARALRPLDQVTSTARAITAGDRGARLRPDRPGTELGQAASAFDAMLDEVEGAERQARAAEQRLRAFLSDAAHELRTPLSGVQAAAERLLRGGDDRASREQLSVTVIREARRASRLADDLLTMARIDSGLELHRVPVPLRGLAESVLGVARLANPDATFTVVGDAGAVEADPDRITQVLTNLVNNALAATRHQGRVTVALARTNGAATAEVADDGPGVPTADAERVFERLVRLDPSRSGGGSGLGLSIARGIAAAHGGSLVLVPPAGRGATFRLTLPV